MAASQEEEILIEDRRDVLEVLSMRFGTVPEDIMRQIEAVRQPEAMQRLILVAANAADWDVFLEELREGEASFRILGERFDPSRHHTEKG